ncbi:MAG: type II secretion system protein GspE [Candidatus Omnitrophica bacterium]|nr:type II secretion system protein GspE [Candidatus Omnitrophota bacterium]
MSAQLTIREKIIDALKESGLIEQKKLDSLIKESGQGGERDIVKKLISGEIIDEDHLLPLLSQALGIPSIDMSRVNLDKESMSLIPEKVMRRHGFIPISRIGKQLTLAVSDPTDILAIDDVKVLTKCDVEIVLASRKDLQEALKSYYGEAEEDFSEIIKEEEAGTDVELVGDIDSFDVQEITKKSEAAPIVKIVGLIISEAIKKRASDIHIEPLERSLRVRYRIDGVLHEEFDLPKKNQNAIIARLKIMSKMDITETRVPQDGRFRIQLEGKEIDFRVSVLPLTSGNKIVLRALDKSNLSLGLDTLGFLPGPLADFKEAISRPFGIILVTGPTGSGKSTTLYSILNELNVPERNIVTIEDPVEYQVQGLTQMATHEDIGLDFATGLRSMLRQSPDVIMVGEIRDFETADIAIKASLTGQLVFSTLHTNDAVGAITRLENMGVEPFLISSSLIMTCAQRLMRRICPNCKVAADIPKEVIEDIREKYPEAREVDTFYKGKGCGKCNHTGYRGRMGTLETVLVDDTIRDMIHKKRSEEEIKEHLRSKGVKALRGNAMIKFIRGDTTLEEVLRIT